MVGIIKVWGIQVLLSAPFNFSEPEKLSFVSSTYQVEVQVEVQQNLTPISD